MKNLTLNLKSVLKHHLRELTGIAIYLGILSLITWSFGVIGVDKIKEIIILGGFWSPFLFIIFHTLTIIVAPFEGSFLMLASGTLFGYWLGVVYTIIAGFIGSSINFWISRIFGKKIIEKLIGHGGVKNIDTLSKRLNEHPILLIPLMATGLFDIVGYAAGLTKVDYKKFLIAVTFSSLVNVPIYVAIGRGLIEGNNTLLWLVIGIIIATIFYFILKYLQKKFKFKT